MSYTLVPFTFRQNWTHGNFLEPANEIKLYLKIPYGWYTQENVVGRMLNLIIYYRPICFYDSLNFCSVKWNLFSLLTHLSVWYNNTLFLLQYHYISNLYHNKFPLNFIIYLLIQSVSKKGRILFGLFQWRVKTLHIAAKHIKLFIVYSVITTFLRDSSWGVKMES